MAKEPDGEECMMSYKVSSNDETFKKFLEYQGYATIHSWEKELRNVLKSMLNAVENKQSLGYFDAIIDIETHCNLIKLVRNRYIYNQNVSGGYTGDPRLLCTKKDIDECFRGGYDDTFKERLYRLLL